LVNLAGENSACEIVALLRVTVEITNQGSAVAQNAGLSLRTTGFDPSSIYVRFVVDKVTLVEVKVKYAVVQVLRLCTDCRVHRRSRGIGKGRVHHCTGTEALYRLYGP